MVNLLLLLVRYLRWGRVAEPGLVWAIVGEVALGVAVLHLLLGVGAWVR